LTVFGRSAIIFKGWVSPKQDIESDEMDFTIDQNSYDEYLEKNDFISNERIRPDDQNFFDALLSVDMKNDPDGKRIIKIIKAL
jgi:hypothetical protein